jgi:hypothetical protein
MPTLMSDIRAGLAANLRTVQDGTGKPQVNEYRLDSPSPPMLQVTGFDEMTPTAFQAGGYSIGMIVQGFCATVTDKGGQGRLDEWLFPTGTRSVWRAIESDRTLGGKVAALAVTSCEGSQIFTLRNGTEVIGSTWHVQVEI